MTAFILLVPLGSCSRRRVTSFGERRTIGIEGPHLREHFHPGVALRDALGERRYESPSRIVLVGSSAGANRSRRRSGTASGHGIVSRRSRGDNDMLAALPGRLCTCRRGSITVSNRIARTLCRRIRVGLAEKPVRGGADVGQARIAGDRSQNIRSSVTSAVDVRFSFSFSNDGERISILMRFDEVLLLSCGARGHGLT